MHAWSCQKMESPRASLHRWDTLFPFLFIYLALLCIFARSYWDCVTPDLRILFDVAQQQSSFFVCFLVSLSRIVLLTFCGLSLLLHFWLLLFLPVRYIIMHSHTMYRRSTGVLLLHQEKQYFHCRSEAVFQRVRGSKGWEFYIFCPPSS